MSCHVDLGPLCVYCLPCSFYMSRTFCYVVIFTDFPQVAPHEDFAPLTFVPLSPLEYERKGETASHREDVSILFKACYSGQVREFAWPRVLQHPSVGSAFQRDVANSGDLG